MHYVIEGPDGAGKSSLITRLTDLGVVVQSRHTLALPAGTDLSAHYLDALNAERATAFDRLFLSEMVYGPILRQTQRVDLPLIQTLRRSRHFTTILCLPPEEICYRETRKRPYPAYQTDEFLRRAYEEFAALITHESVDYVYDWTRPFGHRMLVNLNAYKHSDVQSQMPYGVRACLA